MIADRRRHAAEPRTIGIGLLRMSGRSSLFDRPKEGAYAEMRDMTPGARFGRSWNTSW